MFVKNKGLKIFIVATYIPLANCQIADLGVIVYISPNNQIINVLTI